MDDWQTLIVQSVSEILTGMATLDEERRRMFLIWLQSHQNESRPISNEMVKDRLTKRFAELPEEGIERERQLMLSEIEWWRDLDDGRLAEIMAGNGQGQ